jgi:hypothetical protein
MYFTLSWLIEGLNNGQTIHPEQTKTFGGSLLRNSGDRLMCPTFLIISECSNSQCPFHLKPGSL